VIGLFLKGKEAETELAEARKTWRFTASLIPSVSGTDGRIIRLERLGRV
jgi:16S rRNA (guanine527-N7)-methyltransferase